MARRTIPLNLQKACPWVVVFFIALPSSVLGSVVIWEPESSPLTGPALTSILDSLAIGYDYVTGSMPDLSLYSAAFICLGVYSDNYALSVEEAIQLVGYLDGGGRVYMEGGDCWAYDSARTTYNEYFGIQGLSDGSGDIFTVTGDSGTMAMGMSYTYLGGNSYMDDISPLPGAKRIFTNPSDGAGCGVSNDGGVYRTVGLVFELGGLVDGTFPSTRANLVGKILMYFGLVETAVWDCGDQRYGGTAVGQNYPNPFNPSTLISYQLAEDSEVRLAIYEVSGRLVKTLVDEVKSAGSYGVTWNGLDDRGEKVASGVYFAVLSDSRGNITSRKLITLK
jgi:hypothetical protein